MVDGCVLSDSDPSMKVVTQTRMARRAEGRLDVALNRNWSAMTIKSLAVAQFNRVNDEKNVSCLARRGLKIFSTVIFSVSKVLRSISPP
jgi:hypothetical protein